MLRRLFVFVTLLCAARAEEKFGPYAEPDFPVLTSTVDFTGWEKQGFPKDNIAVRGLIIKLPHDLYVCFDQDLLRVAGIWQGEPGGKFLTHTDIAGISYNIENKKSEPGQKDLPKPIGKPLMATGLMPGWILKAANDVTPEDLKDPRPPGPDPKDPGRGPLPAGKFQWRGYMVETAGYLYGMVTIHYTCGNTRIHEYFYVTPADGVLELTRRLHLTINSRPEPPDFKTFPGTEPLSLVGGFTTAFPHIEATQVADTSVFNYPGVKSWEITYRIPWLQKEAESNDPVYPRWHGKPVETQIKKGTEHQGLEVEEITLPVPNQWKRIVRPSGISFTPEGKALVCTIDGDVWMVEGLAGDKPVWRRYASGLHEPQSIVTDLYSLPEEDVRGPNRNEPPPFGQCYVFTRDGIVHIGDSSIGQKSFGYWNFCNAFTQTGETREYPMDMVAKPGGGFYIAKGGQMLTRKTPQGGRVLEVSADGKTVTEICTGLRQPYLGIHPKTGLLTASDQQGHWTPSTPIRYIRPGAYYGFEEAAPRPIPSVIDPPACWIPHEVNQSAAGQVWAVDAKMGPLNDRLLHLMYYRPGILAAFLDEQQKQAATVPTQLQFDFPLLKGAINPVDGLLYVVGFRIWGTESQKMAGMARIRPTGKPSPLPAAVRAVPQGVHLRFTEKVDAASLQPGNFTASRWNYKRTSGYGSAHYKLDGTPGVEPLPCTGVQLSADGLGVLVHLPDMKRAEQYRLDWRLTSAAGMKMENFTCLTLYALEPFDAAAAGFDAAFKPKAAAEMTAAAAQEPASAEAGQKLVTQLGCLACHSTNGSMEGMKGPTWKDLYGGEFPLHNGGNYTADAAHLKESILNPTAKIRKGFKNADIGMPPYAGILSDNQLESVLLYLRSLSGK